MDVNEANRIGGVMVSLLASGVVDSGSDPQLGQTEDNKISTCSIST
jgi:rRNA pseudouridine-1189 N-methylase Emg1 (Nep1/Mra1 family)